MNTITLQDHVDSLQSSINLLKSELEDKNQIVYNYKKQLTVALALEKDYQQEIETLQSSESAEAKTLKEKITELESDVIKLKDHFNSELLQRSEIIDNLKDQIKEFSKIRKNNSDSSDDHQYALKRNLELKEELNSLTKNFMEIEANINYLQIQNVSLEQTNNILYTELKDKNQYCACKSQELASAKHKLQVLQEDIFLIKLELESLKSKPLNTCSKGNSLFAEVEDSCQKVQQSLEQTKKNYSKLKQDVTTKMKQLSIMRTQNIELSTKLNVVNGSNEDYDKIIENYKAKVRSWESVIDKRKMQVSSKQLKFHGNDLPQYAIEFANNTLKTKWASEVKLLESLDNESRKKLETYVEIESVNDEMRKWRRIAQQLKVKIEKLENFISEIDLYNTLGARSDLEECFNLIEQELSQIDSNVDITIEDILKCGTAIGQKEHLIEDDTSTDTICNELLRLSSIVVKPDNSLENFQDSNVTNLTEIENTFSEKLMIKDEATYNMLPINDEIKNESIDVSPYQIKVTSELNDRESYISDKLENKFFEIAETANDDYGITDQSLEQDVVEVDISMQDVSVIEIDSTFDESNSSEEHSLALVKAEDSSVEIVGEFKITPEEDIKLTQYDDNYTCAVKNGNSEDNNSAEVITEYKHPQNGNSLNNIEVIQYDENISEQAKEETSAITVEIAMGAVHSQNEILISHMESNQCSKENLILQANTTIDNFEHNNIQTEVKPINFHKQNVLDNVQAKPSARNFSTPAVKSTNGIKSGSESKINSNGIQSHNKLQKQNSLSSIKTKQCTKNYYSALAVHQKPAMAVKSVPNAVPTKKYVSQSEKKVLKSTTTNIPIPARKKLL